MSFCVIGDESDDLARIVDSMGKRRNGAAEVYLSETCLPVIKKSMAVSYDIVEEVSHDFA